MVSHGLAWSLALRAQIIPQGRGQLGSLGHRSTTGGSPRPPRLPRLSIDLSRGADSLDVHRFERIDALRIRAFSSFETRWITPCFSVPVPRVLASILALLGDDH